MKVRRSTRNFHYGPAMTADEMELCLQRGAEVVGDVHASGCNVVSFGEMGSGNTSPSSMWMHLFTNTPRRLHRGGAGLDNDGIRHKYEVLKESLDNYRGDGSVTDIMAWFGGYELVMAVGGMLRAAELGMLIIVDGFIMTNCILAASKLYPKYSTMQCSDIRATSRDTNSCYRLSERTPSYT